jgi:PAS domain S-box-containing protein
MDRNATEPGQAGPQELLQFALEAANVLPWEWDLAGDSLRWAGDPAALLGPLPPGLARHPTFLELVHADDRERFLAAGREARARAGDYQLEFRLVRTDGAVRWVMARGKSVCALPGGAIPDRLFGVTLDIHERKLAQLAAEALARQQKALLDNLPDVAWLKDADGRLIAVNPVFCRRFGMDRDEAIGRTDLDIFPPDKAAGIRAEDADVMASGKPLRYESSGLVGGERRWVEVIKTPIFDAAGRPVGTVGASRDITARKAAERELVESERRFHMLADLSSDWYWEQDAQLRFTVVRAPGQARRPVDASLSMGKTREEMQLEGVDEAQWAAHREALAARRPFSDFQYWIGTPTGRRRVTVSGQPLHDEAGAFTGYRGIGRDITDQWTAAEELRLARERLTLAMDASQLALWDTDLAGGRVWLSEAWKELLGEPPAETRTSVTDLAKLVPPEDLPDLLRLQRETVLGMRSGYAAEHRVRTAAGAWKWIQSQGRVTQRDAQGRALRMSGTNADITVRKAMEAARRSMERNLQQALSEAEALLQTSPVALLVSRDRVILRCNQAMEQLVGVGPGELLGKSTRVLFPDDDSWALVGRRAYPVVEDGRTFRDELGLVRHDGTPFWAVVAGRKLSADTNEMVFSYTDVTEQREMAQALAEARDAANAASKAKSGFLATMSHEIRTPMNGVLGMLELLELTELSGEQRDTLTLAHESAVALLRLIDDILDFSKIEAGQLEIRPEPVSLSSLANHSATMYLELASRKGLPLECRVSPDIAPAHIADSLRVSQIVNNLLSNAIKFTARGKVTLSVDLERSTDTDETVRIRVTDSGIGVSPEQQARLFQPFVQGDSNTTRKYGGTGLGLSICKRLAEMMDGTIAMESVPGSGTAITVVLRLPKADPAALAARGPLRVERLAALRAAGRGETQQPPRPGGPRLLIVEDHPVNLSLIRRQVGLLGYEADVALDGQEALDKWREGGHSLVLTDCHMPGMDGYELSRQIRAEELRRGVTDPVPVIACTANAMADDAKLCFDAGMSDYLPKPVTLSALKAKLERWAGGAAAANEPTATEGTPMTQSEPQAPVLNAATLEQFTGGDKDLAREIYGQFLSANQGDTDAMRAALAAGDMAAVNATAHRIKGASRMIGANPMADAAEALEKAGKAGDLAAVQAGMPAFDREQARLVEELKRETAP